MQKCEYCTPCSGPLFKPCQCGCHKPKPSESVKQPELISRNGRLWKWVCEQHDWQSNVNDCPEHRESVKEGVWCRHTEVRTGVVMTGGYIFKDDPDRIKFCTTCGTPRPTPKTLAMKLEDFIGHIMPSSVYDYMNNSEKLAEIATQHFNKEKSS